MRGFGGVRDRSKQAIARDGQSQLQALATGDELAAPQHLVLVGQNWCDGTTHRVTSPLAIMQRLSVLVSRPGLQLIRPIG